MKLKIVALALLLGGAGLLALAPTASADHCDAEVCLPERVTLCVDGRPCIIYHRPPLPSCSVDFDTLEVDCQRT